MRNCHHQTFSHQKVLEGTQGKDLSDPHWEGAYVDSIWSKPKRHTYKWQVALLTERGIPSAVSLAQEKNLILQPD